jgi:nitrate reductase gamma subunit
MSFLTVLYALLFYAATAILIGGLVYRITVFAKTPAPLKIPTTPAPVTETGVVLRMFREVVFFESLFRATKWTWIFGWLFHISLLLVLLRHARYFIDPQWMLVPDFLWTGVELVQPFGVYAGFGMLIGLTGLLGRRFFVDRVRYISAPSDYLMLILLMAIAGSGLLMKYFTHTDIVAVKQFFLGLMAFNWNVLPADGMLILHLSLVLLLMVIFPFSKLLHAPGIFFSPTRNQVDNPREKRHIADWARRLEENG